MIVRLILALTAVLVCAQCASKGDDRFHVGEGPRGYVIMGVAEVADERAPAYTMLWRRIGADDRFLDIDGDTVFEAHTNSGDTLRLSGLPGEFAMRRVEPGIYALDSVFAVLRENRLNYFAQGVVEGPERPSFEVRPGEAVYLGIWEMGLNGVDATSRLWRLSPDDMNAVVGASDALVGNVQVRETRPIQTPCAPHRLNSRTQRLVC